MRRKIAAKRIKMRADEGSSGWEGAAFGSFKL
jgi:hypothetical protein